MGLAIFKTPLIGNILCTLAVASLTFSVTACSSNENRAETVGSVVGGVVGAVAGAVLGSKVGNGMGKSLAQSMGVILGGTLGSMWGQDIAKGMTDVDKNFHERTTTDTLEYGKPGEKSSWSNPDSGNSGAVEAGETFKNDTGEDCRTFETTVQVEGEDRTAQGTACRTADGAWQVMEEPAV